jgi:hypothetical protein
MRKNAALADRELVRRERCVVAIFNVSVREAK